MRTPEGVRFSLLALAGALLAAPVQAAPVPAQDDCRTVLPQLEAALPKVSGPSRTPLQLLRVRCLDELGRAEDVSAVYRDLAASDPRNPMVRSLGVLVAARAADFTGAADQLAALAEESPGALDAITGQLWRGIAQKLGEQGRFDARDKVSIALARADWQPGDQPDVAEAVVQSAIQALVKRGELSEAEVLLGRVTMPALLLGMASERLYAPLWPQIETALGPQSGQAVDRYAAERLDLFARMPDDPAARRGAIRAFIMLGRHAEAAELGRAVLIENGMSEDAISSVRLEAQALAALGRASDAIARMREFAALDPARSPEAAAGLVALAELLDEHGHAEEALQVARRATAGWADALSPWGEAWLRRTEVCALHALGRREEERVSADLLKRAASINQGAAIEGLLCAGRDAEAAEIATAAFATAEGASDLSDQFQPDDAMWAPSPSRLRSLWSRLRERTDVKVAFDRRLRILPRTLWPARAPRPIPRIGGGLPTT